MYNRLAFGLALGPASWQKLLEDVLKDIDGIFIYLDDILIFGKSEAEHDTILAKVLERLAANHMPLSIEFVSRAHGPNAPMGPWGK